MSRRLAHRIRIGPEGEIKLPPAVERIAKNGDVFAMIDHGCQLDTVSFDDPTHPTKVVFAFGNDQFVIFRADKQEDSDIPRYAR